MNPLHFLWFTFADDSRCLAESVASVRQAAPAAKIIIAEEEDRPVMPAVRGRIAADSWIQTQWHRAGNLNGLGHLTNQLALMEACAPEGGAVVKIDSDAVLLNADWLTEHDFAATPAICLCQPAWWFQGGCYAIASPVLPLLQRNVPQAQVICSQLAPKWPEDQVTGALITLLCGPGAIAHHHGWPLGRGVAHYDYAANSAFESYFDFDVVNFGSRHLMKAPVALRRALAADTMRAFRGTHAAVTRTVSARL